MFAFTADQRDELRLLANFIPDEAFPWFVKQVEGAIETYLVQKHAVVPTPRQIANMADRFAIFFKSLENQPAAVFVASRIMRGQGRHFSTMLKDARDLAGIARRIEAGQEVSATELVLAQGSEVPLTGVAPHHQRANFIEELEYIIDEVAEPITTAAMGAILELCCIASGYQKPQPGMSFREAVKRYRLKSKQD